VLAEIGRSPPPFALRDQDGRNATPLEDDVMGDPVLLVFDRNAADSGPESSRELLRAVAALRDRLDGIAGTIFVLTRRPADRLSAIAGTRNMPFRLLSDADGAVFEAYGVIPAEAPAVPASVVLDPNGRVVGICEGIDTAAQFDGVAACLERLDAERPRGTIGVHPPVLVVPNALDASFRGRLIEVWHRPVPFWEGDGMVSQGFNVERGDFKVRNARYGNVTQYVLRDPVLAGEIDREMMRRVAPEIEKAFGYRPARREDYRIACYDSVEGGSLPAHRDNPTRETRHRRFTVSVNLNNDDFEGGELAFRESSDHRYEVGAGTAIVWSCALLHEIMPVTAGRRFIVATHLID
jgi:peroxiredoxin